MCASPETQLSSSASSDIFAGIRRICDLKRSEVDTIYPELRNYLYSAIFDISDVPPDSTVTNEAGITLTSKQVQEIDEAIKQAVKKYTDELAKGKTVQFLAFLVRWTAGLVLKILSIGKISIMKTSNSRFNDLKEYVQREKNKAEAEKFAKKTYERYLTVSNQQVEREQYDSNKTRILKNFHQTINGQNPRSPENEIAHARFTQLVEEREKRISENQELVLSFKKQAEEIDTQVQQQLKTSSLEEGFTQVSQIKQRVNEASDQLGNVVDSISEGNFEQSTETLHRAILDKIYQAEKYTKELEGRIKILESGMREIRTLYEENEKYLKDFEEYKKHVERERESGEVLISTNAFDDISHEIERAKRNQKSLENYEAQIILLRENSSDIQKRNSHIEKIGRRCRTRVKRNLDERSAKDLKQTALLGLKEKLSSELNKSIKAYNDTDKYKKQKQDVIELIIEKYIEALGNEFCITYAQINRKGDELAATIVKEASKDANNFLREWTGTFDLRAEAAAEIATETVTEEFQEGLTTEIQQEVDRQDKAEEALEAQIIKQLKEKVSPAKGWVHGEYTEQRDAAVSVIAKMFMEELRNSSVPEKEQLRAASLAITHCDFSGFKTYVKDSYSKSVGTIESELRTNEMITELVDSLMRATTEQTLALARESAILKNRAAARKLLTHADRLKFSRAQSVQSRTLSV